MARMRSGPRHAATATTHAVHAAPSLAQPVLSEFVSSGGELVAAGRADVGTTREALRRRRVRVLGLAVVAVLSYLAWAWVTGRRSVWVPHPDPFIVMEGLLVLVIGGSIAAMFLGGGRSPHVTYRPEQVDVSLDDVVGIEQVKEDVVRSLNLFLAHKAFRTEMGGTPRRGLLFEGLPGTGKTHLAKAMAKEAGVPFLFVSATSFQSMYYGATARKIRSYFKALRKAARREGGAIGFIEEIDAIAMARGGLSMSPPSVLGAASSVRLPSISSEGVGGVVNELLVQMQSFDAPTGTQRLHTSLVDAVNLLLPPGRALRRPVPPPTNVLLIAATNRADNLDPALLRPGRFDRRLTFDVPAKAGRRLLVDHFLARKAHVPALDADERRDALASVTQGYTPVMIEHLLDEALVNALRRGDRAMTWEDLERARLTEEVGMGQPVGYTDHERRLIATHESGHATVAWLLAPERRLEVLTIVKRRDALGMLAHGDRDDVYTRSRTEMLALIGIAMGGQVAEEIFFGDISTGPSGDLAYATSTAAQMVGAAGMAGSLVSFAAVSSGPVGDTNLVGRVLGDADGRRRVEEILNAQKALVSELLERHQHLVVALRDALLDREELVGDQITAVLEHAAVQASVIDLTERPGVVH